jgi:hypothetical protein
MLRSKSGYAPPKGKHVEKEFIEGFTQPRREGIMVNTLPYVERRSTDGGDSAGSPVKGSIKPHSRTKGMPCFGCGKRQ